jgi:hypothetical protein
VKIAGRGPESVGGQQKESLRVLSNKKMSTKVFLRRDSALKPESEG